MKRILFFALKDDILPVLAAVEDEAPLKYVRTGNFTVPAYDCYTSGAEIPRLGQASFASAVGCDKFLVTQRVVPIEVETLALSAGGTRYLVDQLMNPDTVVFAPGGVWDNTILLYGGVTTVSDSVLAQHLMKRFSSAIKKRFSRVGPYLVGPQALCFLKEGNRLTLAAQTPREFDLKL